MNKIRILSFLLFLLFVGQCYGQTTQWSVPVENPQAYFSEVVNIDAANLIMVDATSFVSLNNGPAKDYHFSVYDKNLELVRKVPIEYKLGQQEMLYQFTINTKRTFYVFASTIDKKGSNNSLYFQKLDPQTLDPIGRLVKVFDTENHSRFHNGRIDYKFSPDSSKVLIYSNPYFRRNEPEQFDFAVFDIEMNQIWTRKTSLPYKESETRIEDVVVDNDGSVFVIARNGLLLERTCSNCPIKKKVDHVLFAFSEKNQQVIEHTLDPKDQELIGIKFHFNSNDDLICAGFFSNKKADQINGTFFLKFDRNKMTITSTQASDFELDSPRYVYEFRKIISKGNDGFLLIGEQYQEHYSDPQQRMAENTYGDILVVDIDNSGKIRWQVEIPKHQKKAGVQSIVSSFATMVFEDRIMLIYNDHVDNLALDLSQKHRKNFSLGDKNGAIVQTTVDFKGNVSSNAIFLKKEIAVILCPSLFLRIDPERMLVFGGESGSTQLGIYTFKPMP